MQPAGTLAVTVTFTVRGATDEDPSIGIVNAVASLAEGKIVARVVPKDPGGRRSACCRRSATLALRLDASGAPADLDEAIVAGDDVVMVERADGGDAGAPARPAARADLAALVAPLAHVTSARRSPFVTVAAHAVPQK